MGEGEGERGEGAVASPLPANMPMAQWEGDWSNE